MSVKRTHSSPAPRMRRGPSISSHWPTRLIAVEARVGGGTIAPVENKPKREPAPECRTASVTGYEFAAARIDDLRGHTVFADPSE